MATLNAWSTTDANNNATPPDGWPEGTMKYSEVNDAGRAVQGTVRRFFGDINGSLDLAYDNPTNTYSVALNEVGYTTIFRGLTFRGLVATANASASPSITVNSTISATLKRLDGSTIAAGDLQPGMYLFVCDGTAFRVGGKFPVPEQIVKSPEANSLVAGGGAAITTGTKNTFFGVGAGDAVTTGSTNVIVGDGAASGVTTGYDNVVIGSGAGLKMSHGNVVMGARVFASASLDGSENFNTLIGQETCESSAAGISQNTAVGYRAGRNLASNDNALFGYLAGYDITTGASNVAVGSNAATGLTAGYDNVVIGAGAGGQMDYSNTVVGTRAFSSANQNGTEIRNVFIGQEAGYLAQAGASRNSAVGYRAGVNIGGDYNTFMGYLSGYGLTDASTRNIAIGPFSLNIGSALAMNDNVAIGYKAGYNLSDTGGVGAHDNVLIGTFAGQNATGGTKYMVAIGPYAGPTSRDASYELFIDNTASDNPFIGGRFVGADGFSPGTVTFCTVVAGTINDVEINGNTSSGESPLLIRDGTTLKRVTYGIADSGGTGYKVLRVVN